MPHSSTRSTREERRFLLPFIVCALLSCKRLAVAAAVRGSLVYGLGLFGSEARQLAGSGAHWPISQTGERLSPINIVFFTFISQLDIMMMTVPVIQLTQ